MFQFDVQMILGKARKRKWKENKLMKEYAKVHQKDQEATENLPTAAESVHTSLHPAFYCFIQLLSLSFVMSIHKRVLLYFYFVAVITGCRSQQHQWLIDVSMGNWTEISELKVRHVNCFYFEFLFSICQVMASCTSGFISLEWHCLVQTLYLLWRLFQHFGIKHNMTIDCLIG